MHECMADLAVTSPSMSTIDIMSSYISSVSVATPVVALAVGVRGAGCVGAGHQLAQAASELLAWVSTEFFYIPPVELPKASSRLQHRKLQYLPLR
jgi:NAD(P)H-dependent FMN reductase